RNRGRVPPVQVERLPRGMDRGGLEVAAVPHDVAADLADAAQPQGVGQLAQAGEGVRLAGALAQRVGGEAAFAEGRIAPAVEDEVALQYAPGHRPGGVQAG